MRKADDSLDDIFVSDVRVCWEELFERDPSKKGYPDKIGDFAILDWQKKLLDFLSRKHGFGIIIQLFTCEGNIGKNKIQDFLEAEYSAYKLKSNDIDKEMKEIHKKYNSLLVTLCDIIQNTLK